MPEAKLQHIIPRPEDILTLQEATILQQADSGLLPCPCCGQPLEGGMVVIEGVYEGVLLACPDVVGCAFVEG